MEMPSFDTLKELAQRDPDAFETLRAELIEDFIKNSPAHHQHRLRGLQFVIDNRRRLASNPMKALIEIQGMMHDSLAELDQALRGHAAVRASGEQASVDLSGKKAEKARRCTKVTPIGTKNNCESYSSEI